MIVFWQDAHGGFRKKLSAAEVARMLNMFGAQGFQEDVHSLFVDYFTTRNDVYELDQSSGDDRRKLTDDAAKDILCPIPVVQ